MTKKDLDVAIEKCERIMELDTRTLKNPESENGWLFEKVYDLLMFLRQFQFATDINVGDTISRQAAIDAVRKAKDKSEAHRMLVQMPSTQQEYEQIPADDVALKSTSNVFKSPMWWFDVLKEIEKAGYVICRKIKQ